MGSIRLVVQADDLGMCHAVNRGILRAFREGIVTQSTLMAPAPWIAEGIALARRHRIPVGLHCTLTSEWDHLRWGPLTGGDTLHDGSGTFPRDAAAVQARVDPAQAGRELVAQAQRLVQGGVVLRFLDGHMGIICPPAVERVAAHTGLPCLYPEARPVLPFSSRAELTDRAAADKTAWLLDWIEGLAPGTHLLRTHPGEDADELRGLTGVARENHRWAHATRVSDLEALLDPRVRRRLGERGVELAAVRTPGAWSAGSASFTEPVQPVPASADNP